MKCGGKIEICALIGILLSTGAKAVESSGTDRPYDGIVERNVFNLHAPPPAINPADLIKHEPPPKVTFTGITTILGRKLAFLTIPGPKPGVPPDSMMLAEGQAQNDVEVKEIDDKAGIVKIVNHDEPQTLDFEHNGATPSGPAAPIPNATRFPRPSLPPPNVMPTPGNVIRPLRTFQPRGGPVSELNNGGNDGQASAPLSPEEQVALIEIQRMKYQQENNPISAIFPRTEMTPEMNGNQQQQPQ
jgi:hypothetical protein